MIQLTTGLIAVITVSNRVELPHGVDGSLWITLKCRATGATKTARHFSQNYSRKPRACKMILSVIAEGVEDLDAGVIKLSGPDFPSGYYSYIMYQGDRLGENREVIDVGVAYLTRTITDDGAVTYKQPSTTVAYKTYEK